MIPPTQPWWNEQWRVAIFDLDDTLLRTFHTGFLKLRLVETELNLGPVDHVRYTALYGRLSFEACLAAWYPGRHVAELVATYASMRGRVPRQPVVPFHQIQKQLASRGVRIGILSNCPRRDLNAKLATAGAVLDQLDFAFGVEDLPAPKPDPRAFAPVLERTTMPPQLHVYVGDAPGDLLAAEGAGLGFVGVNTGPRAWMASSKHPVIDSITAFVEEGVA